MKKLFIATAMVILAVFSLMAQNPRNVLIYNLTSTDCGPCSCMDSILNARIFPEFPNTIVLALHGMGSKFWGYRGDSARSYFNERFEPAGFIDGLGYDVPYKAIRDSVASRYLHQTEAPVKIEILSKNWNPDTRTVSLGFRATNNGAQLDGAYRYNVVITEGKVHHGHRTYTGCATPDQQIPPWRDDYWNHNVVRRMEYWRQGDSLIGPLWPAGQAITRSVSVPVDTAWASQNCNVVVMVYRNDDSLYKAPIMQVVQQSVTGGLGMSERAVEADGIRLIYPNPACGFTNIHLSMANAGDCMLQVVGHDGKLVETLIDSRLEQGIYHIELDTQSYPPGIYLLVLVTRAGKFTRTMVIAE